jgi:hypothetical protein
MEQTQNAIKNFGIYSFKNSGPEEVMELSNLKNKFKQLSQSEKIVVVKDLKNFNQESEVLIALIYSSSLKDSELEEIIKEGNDLIFDFFN